MMSNEASLPAGAIGKPRRSGTVEPLASFMTNPTGSAVVNTTGSIRQIVQRRFSGARRYLVIHSRPVVDCATIGEVPGR